MKYYLILAATILTLAACATKQASKTENLPKDISLKPENNLAQQQDREMLSAMMKDIEAQIARVTCTDASKWKFTPIGAKACGGPSAYIAYPTEFEDELLPRIETYTQMQRAFNMKYQLMSDCRMVLPPSGITCENGKAVLAEGLSADVQRIDAL